MTEPEIVHNENGWIIKCSAIKPRNRKLWRVTLTAPWGTTLCEAVRPDRLSAVNYATRYMKILIAEQVGPPEHFLDKPAQNMQ